MKISSFGYENRMRKRLERVSVLLLVLQIFVVVAVFVWPHLMVCIGVPQVAYGILHWVAVGKKWDAFYSFYVGGEADSCRKRHILTIVYGVFWTLVGIGESVVLTLVGLGVINV